MPSNLPLVRTVQARVYRVRPSHGVVFTPTMSNLTSFLDVVFVLAAIYVAKHFFAKKAGRPLPPGPYGIPIVGNVFDMPKTKEWETFAQWGEQYGKPAMTD